MIIEQLLINPNPLLSDLSFALSYDIVKAVLAASAGGYLIPKWRRYKADGLNPAVVCHCFKSSRYGLIFKDDKFEAHCLEILMPSLVKATDQILTSCNCSKSDRHYHVKRSQSYFVESKKYLQPIGAISKKDLKNAIQLFLSQLENRKN